MSLILTSFHVEEETRDTYKKLAKKQGTTKANLWRKALDAYLDAQSKHTPEPKRESVT